MSTYDDFFKIKTLQKEMKGKHTSKTLTLHVNLYLFKLYKQSNKDRLVRVRCKTQLAIYICTYEVEYEIFANQEG
jgi:hypothetical protein